MPVTASTAGLASKTPSQLQSDAGEDRRLLLRYREGDPRARDELVERYIPLARQIACRYQGKREPLDDLVQVASVGLVKAIDRFDPARTTAFSSYAVPTMVGELKRYFRDFGWAVHVPRGMQERTAAVHSAVAWLSRELGRSPSPSEVGEALAIDQEQVLEALEATLAYDAISLDAPRRGAEDSEGSGLGDTLGEEDERFELIDLGVTIAPAVRELPERERRILHMRFVGDMTQSEIASEFGVSQMHVSRLIRRSIAQLRKAADEENHVPAGVTR